MTLASLLQEYENRFPRNGAFELRRGEQIQTRAKEERGPEEAWVYLIYSRRGRKRELLYVGKAGTLRQDGSLKDQKLPGRIRNRRKGMRSQQYYQLQFQQHGFDALPFRWFVTYAGNVGIIPAKAEADLLQAFFDDTGRLPLWNDAL